MHRKLPFRAESWQSWQEGGEVAKVDRQTVYLLSEFFVKENSLDTIYFSL